MVRYKPGDVVAISSPFAFALNSNERGVRCDFCFQSPHSSTELPPVVLKRCSNCKLSFYCDAKCQKSAWKSFHKDECPKLSKFTSENCPTETFIFIARLASKVLKKNGLKEVEEVCNVSRSFADLKSHVEEIRADGKRLKQFDALNSFLSLYFPELRYDENLLMSLFGRMVINSYTICDTEMRPVGSGLYLGASIFDHSCDPNATVVYNGTTLFVRAIKDIEAASHRDIFINYIDPISPTFKRRKQLTSQYYFTCDCCCCLNTTVDDTKTEVLEKEKSSEFLGKCSVFLKDSTSKINILCTDDKRELYSQCVEKLENMKEVIGDGHILRVWMLDLLFDLSIHLQFWEESLEFGLSAVKYYRLYYNCYFPAVGLQLFKIGKIQNLLGQLRKARETFFEAKRLLHVCYGKDNRVVEELELLLEQCQTEINMSPMEESLPSIRAD